MRRSVQRGAQLPSFARWRCSIQVRKELETDGIHLVQLLVSGLKACGALKDLETGKVLHSAAQLEEPKNKYVETAILDMYSKCGEIAEARRVFDSITPKEDVVPWNALILGYVSNGESQAALELFSRISSPPDARTFVAVLMACSSLASGEDWSQVDGRALKLGSLEKGLALHSEAAKSGFGLDMFVCNILIDMYGKCGSLLDARRVFDRMELHDVVSWTALILGKAENGEFHQALELFESMINTGCSPNARTFVAALVACAGSALEEEKEAGNKLRYLEKGMKLHSFAQRFNLQRDIFVASTLVDLYSKCGSLRDAFKVFSSMQFHDLVTWNALILGYVVNGDSELALDCFEFMKKQGCSPDSRSFVAVLMACSSLAVREEGKLLDGRVLKVSCLQKVASLHSEASWCWESDLFVASGLVDAYSKCGSMVDAAGVFSRMNQWSCASWNSMIQGYVSSGQSEVALKIFWRMIDGDGGVSPDPQSFVAALVACSSVSSGALRAESLSKGSEVHARALELGFDSDLFLASTLVDMYAQCGSLVKARVVFDGMASPNSVSWNSMLQGYACNGEGEIVLELFRGMACVANERTFVACLLACGSLGEGRDRELKLGFLRKLHSEASRRSFDSNIFLANTLVDMYAKCGSSSEAREVFDSIQSRSVVSWNAMLLGYVVNEENDSALELFTRMKELGIGADSRTYVSALMACGNLSDLLRGKLLHGEICRLGIETEAFVASSLVDFYGKCSSMVSAQQVFDSSGNLQEDLVVWNALLAGYGRQGNSRRLLRVFERMEMEKIRFDGVSFLSVLNACAHAGLVESGRRIFSKMFSEFGVEPELEHYQCMIDLLGRAGEVDEALAMARSMPFKPSVVTWTTLLAACEKWGNVEAGKLVFQSLVCLDDNHGPAYTLMANMYSAKNVV